MTTREKFTEAVAGIVELVQAQARGEAAFMRQRDPAEVAQAIADLVPEHAWSGVVVPILRQRLSFVTQGEVRREEFETAGDGCEATHRHDGDCP